MGNGPPRVYLYINKSELKVLKVLGGGFLSGRISSELKVLKVRQCAAAMHSAAPPTMHLGSPPYDIVAEARRTGGSVVWPSHPLRPNAVLTPCRCGLVSEGRLRRPDTRNELWTSTAREERVVMIVLGFPFWH